MTPARPPVKPTPAQDAHEVGLHEVGDALAASVAQIHRELAQYPSELGVFALQELEVSLPLASRVDELGQVVVRNAPKDGAGGSTYRFKIVQAPESALPVRRAQDPLETLRLLPAADLRKLHEKRIYSVEDFLRITRSAAGLDAAKSLGLQTPVSKILSRSDLFQLPHFPPGSGPLLVRSGVTSLSDLLRRSPQSLSAKLAKLSKSPVEKADVRKWIQDLRLERRFVPARAFPAPGADVQVGADPKPTPAFPVKRIPVRIETKPHALPEVMKRPRGGTE